MAKDRNNMTDVSYVHFAFKKMVNPIYNYNGVWFTLNVVLFISTSTRLEKLLFGFMSEIVSASNLNDLLFTETKI